MEWLLSNIGNLLDMGGGIVGLGTAVVTVASALDRSSKKVNLQDTVSDINKVTGILSCPLMTKGHDHKTAFWLVHLFFSLKPAIHR